MGILNDTQTCDGIANEWEPCSRDLLESLDALVYALITDPQYHLPQIAPNGNYAPGDSNETEDAPDSDNDGISDDDDVCPDENASGHDADADGCIDDSDNDGVKNNVDVCPFDPSDECQLAPEEEIFPEDIPGCVHESAENYNPDATDDDGSCTYEKESTPGFGIFATILSCLVIAFRRKH
jgi:hypothetical protein